MTRTRRLFLSILVVTVVVLVGLRFVREPVHESKMPSTSGRSGEPVVSKQDPHVSHSIAGKASIEEGPSARIAAANTSAIRRQMSPEEEVLSWGDPILEGDLKLDDSRSASARIYRTPMKYPLIMVQELWRVSPADPGVKEPLGERKMVADHLVVRLHEGQDASAFEARLKRQGMAIRKKMYADGLYLVSFPVVGVDSLQKTQKRLSAMPEVRSATPDIFGRGF